MGPSWDQEVSRTPRPKITVDPARRFQGFWGPVWGPKLVHFLLFLGSFLGPLFGPLLDHFWSPFWRHFGTQNGVKKWTLFWKGSWWPSGDILGGFLALLRLSWEAWCSRNNVKTNTKQHFSKSLLFPIIAPWDGFLRPSWLIWGSFFDPKMEPNNH